MEEIRERGAFYSTKKSTMHIILQMTTAVSYVSWCGHTIMGIFPWNLLEGFQVCGLGEGQVLTEDITSCKRSRDHRAVS